MVLNIGDSAPDFELTDPDMKMRTLGEFKGKKIVLSLSLPQVLQYVRRNSVHLEILGMKFLT